jgi:predicted metal-dependent phosphotriesterase family hydrolase
MKALAEEMGDLVAELFTSEFVGLKKGDMGVVDPTLENILGRTLKSIADVVKETFLNMRRSY